MNSPALFTDEYMYLLSIYLAICYLVIEFQWGIQLILQDISVACMLISPNQQPNKEEDNRKHT